MHLFFIFSCNAVTLGFGVFVMFTFAHLADALDVFDTFNPDMTISFTKDFFFYIQQSIIVFDIFLIIINFFVVIIVIILISVVIVLLYCFGKGMLFFFGRFKNNLAC